MVTRSVYKAMPIQVPTVQLLVEILVRKKHKYVKACIMYTSLVYNTFKKIWIFFL